MKIHITAHWRAWLSWLLILGVAVGMRFYQLGQVPVSLYWDEVAMLVDAKSIADTGKDMHGRPWYQVIYPSYGDYKQPVYIWTAAFSVKVFGVSDWALRLPSALTGVMTVILAGVIAHQVLGQRNKHVQLATMIVVAVSPWSILFSRTGFEAHIAQLLLAMSMLILVTSRRAWWQIVLAALLGVLATYAYYSVRFVWPVIAVGGLVLLTPWSKKKIIQISLQVGLALVTFTICLVPMMRSPLYQATNTFRLSTTSILNMKDYAVISNQYREQAGNAFIDRLFFHRDWLKIQELALNYVDHLNPTYLFFTGDPNLRHGTGKNGLFLPIFIIPFIAGLYVLFDRYKKVFFFFGIWWGIALLPASVPDTTPHALRSLNALVPLASIIGIGLAHLVDISLQARFKMLLLISYLLLGVLSVGSFSYHYFTQYPTDSAIAWQVGYRETAESIDQLRQQGYPVYVNHFDERFYLWLMAYGSYTGKDFQSWQSQNYRFSQLEAVFLNTETEVIQAVRDHSKGAALVTPEMLTKLTADSNLNIDTQVDIGYPGQPKRVLVTFARQ